MSTLRIQKLDIKSFKAFLDLSVPINGRNLLVYGKNGAGKSSIYWALYTFLQSAQKQSDDVFKYFDIARPENLINRFTATPDDASISVSFQNEDGVLDSAYTISKTGTQQAISSPTEFFSASTTTATRRRSTCGRSLRTRCCHFAKGTASRTFTSYGSRSKPKIPLQRLELLEKWVSLLDVGMISLTCG